MNVKNKSYTNLKVIKYYDNIYYENYIKDYAEDNTKSIFYDIIESNIVKLIHNYTDIKENQLNVNSSKIRKYNSDLYYIDKNVNYNLLPSWMKPKRRNPIIFL